VRAKKPKPKPCPTVVRLDDGGALSCLGQAGHAGGCVVRATAVRREIAKLSDRRKWGWVGALQAGLRDALSPRKLPAPPTVAEERAAFEEWCGDELPTERRRSRPEEYLGMQTQFAWLGWINRAARRGP
jgi:hypothetical protein